MFTIHPFQAEQQLATRVEQIATTARRGWRRQRGASASARGEASTRDRARRIVDDRVRYVDPREARRDEPRIGSPTGRTRHSHGDSAGRGEGGLRDDASPAQRRLLERTGRQPNEEARR
jgi:hypothetical protein